MAGTKRKKLFFGVGNGRHDILVGRWDEWVPENRVLKHNEANLQKQKELQAQHPE